MALNLATPGRKNPPPSPEARAACDRSIFWKYFHIAIHGTVITSNSNGLLRDVCWRLPSNRFLMSREIIKMFNDTISYEVS